MKGQIYFCPNTQNLTSNRDKVHLIFSRLYTVSETVKACFAFQQRRGEAGPLCTEAIVFVHWQTAHQTMSHAKHSLNSPPAANGMAWERLKPAHHTAFELTQHWNLVYLYKSGNEQVHVVEEGKTGLHFLKKSCR